MSALMTVFFLILSARKWVVCQQSDESLAKLNYSKDKANDFDVEYLVGYFYSLPAYLMLMQLVERRIKDMFLEQVKKDRSIDSRFLRWAVTSGHVTCFKPQEDRSLIKAAAATGLTAGGGGGAPSTYGATRV